MKKKLVVILCIMGVLASVLSGCSEKKTPEIKLPEAPAVTADTGSGGQNFASSTMGQTPEEGSSGGYAGEQPPSVSQGSYTVYTQINENWNGAYLWAWSETYGDLFAQWPGKPMNHISGLWYAMEIPVEYDMVIVNDNGSEFVTQTEDLETNGKDAWIIWDTDGYWYNNTGDEERYDQIYDSMKIPDEKSVSSHLNTLSAVRMENDFAMKMEYGFDCHAVQELACTYYYSCSGMSDAAVTETIQNLRTGFQVNFAQVNCLETSVELRNEMIVATMRFCGLDEYSNAQEMAGILETMSGSDSSGMIDQNGKVILESVFALSDFCVKLG